MKFAFTKALRHSRKSRGLTQVDFSDGPILVLEKEAKKSPTLDKVNAITQTLGIHIVSLIASTCLYLESEQKKDLETLLLIINSCDIMPHSFNKHFPINWL